MSDTEIGRVSVVRTRRDEDGAIVHRIEVSDRLDAVLLAGMASWLDGYAKRWIEVAFVSTAPVKGGSGETEVSGSDGTAGAGVGEVVDPVSGQV